MQKKKPNFTCAVCKRELYVPAKTRRSIRIKRTCGPKCSKIYWREQIIIYGRKRYQRIKNSPKLKAYQKSYYKSEANQERLKARRQTPEYKERLKERLKIYHQTPKYKAWIKKYTHSAKYRAKRNERQSTPEHKAYMKAYQKKQKLLK